MVEEPVRISEYDARWPALFSVERDLISRALGATVCGPIEHVGSTAVPGLAAKPIIDIMVGVADLASSAIAKEPLAGIGYQYFPYRPDVMHWFCKPSPDHRTHHLHLIPVGSRLWSERLAFRDYLRAHPAAAAEYEALKRSLAARYEFDREAYTDAKGPFVERVVAAALGRTTGTAQPA